MRAFLLAAGLGTRLRPLTVAKPKALVPVANRPTIVRLLELLHSHGVKDAYINLHYYPEEIISALDAKNLWGIDIHYSFEPELLGTAGAIEKIGKFINGDKFLLVNTDIVTDIDFSAAVKFHQDSAARATLVMADSKPTGDIEPIGVSSDGRIRVNRVPGDKIRKGVYTGIGIFEPSVIEMIPEGYSTLLDSVLIPLAHGGNLYGCFADGYWADIGKIERYMQTNRDLISGKSRLPIDGRLVGENIWIDETAQIDLTVEIEEPALIGKGACIERGAKIGPNTIIGENCVIGLGVQVSNSILWDNCRIGNNASVNGSVLTEGQEVSSGKRVRGVILSGGIAEPVFNIW